MAPKQLNNQNFCVNQANQSPFWGVLWKSLRGCWVFAAFLLLDPVVRGGSLPDLSVNTTNFPHLQRALASGRAPRIIWFGDSTGVDSYFGIYNWLNSVAVHGVQPGSPFVGWDISYGVYNVPIAFYTDPYYWWGPGGSAALGPGTNFFFAYGPSGKTEGRLGNRLQIWYYSSASNGVATVMISSNNAAWTTLGNIDETSGTPEGTLQITNFPLAAGSWYCELQTISGTFRMPDAGIGIYLTNPPAGALIYDAHAPGLYLASWLAMGSNNIECILTNIAPDVVIYQQIKPVSSYTNYPQFMSYMTNYGQSDVVLGAAQAGSSEVDFLMQDPPVQSSAFSADYIQGVAVTNGCPFWDNYDPLSSWAAITNLGWNADDIIHLNAAGQFFAGRLFLQKLHWPSFWYEAGWLNTNFILTLPQTSTGPNSCVLNAFEDANGSSATAYFQYGLTTNYGHATPPVALGPGAENITAPISGLEPYTIYHFRPVSVSSLGTNYGDDLAFFTPAAAFSYKSFGFNNSGEYRIAFTGTSNVTFTLWDSTNLVNWNEIAVSTGDGSTNYEVSDTNAPFEGACFYKVRWP